ncbi:MAG: ATP-binding protein [Alphaproteobacteria bacterium]|nr:ATP-binding protein [Alphaproteobacteria bacterium]
MSELPEGPLPLEPGPPPPPLVRSVEAFLGWFVPAELRLDPETERRGRLVVASSLSLLGVIVLVLAMLEWTPLYAWGPLPLPRPVVSMMLFSGLVNLSVAFLVRRTGRPDTGALFLVGGLATTFTFIAYFQGGFGAPATWWLAAVPIVSAFLAGPRATVLTAAIVSAVLFLLFGLETNGLLDAPGSAMPTRQAQDVLRAQILLLCFVSFFGWYYERTRQEASRDLVGAYSSLERTNAALRMSQQNVRQIAEHIGQALWMHDLKSDRVVYANPAFEEVFRLSRAKLAADPEVWRRRVLHEDRALFPVEADGKDHVYRLDLDGDARWIRHSVYAVGDETTPTHRSIHIVADITLQRTAEALRERYLETVLEVQENERRHLARELHDETGGSLTALLVGLRGLTNSLDKATQRDMGQQIAEQLRQVVADIGRMARGLHPSVLDELGLIAAVTRLSDDAREAYDLALELRVEGREHEGALSPTCRLAVYRIVQEALTNVSRHANAAHVDISLSIDPQKVAVRVEDDGQGFDPQHPSPRHELSSGLGLVSMQERASLLGGHVIIESAKGAGTTVMGELPVNRPTRL